MAENSHRGNISSYGGVMVVKHLVQHGNSKALVIDKVILQAAGLDENTLFQITVDTHLGVTIQSIRPESSKFDEAKNHIFSEYADLFKCLSER